MRDELIFGVGFFFFFFKLNFEKSILFCFSDRSKVCLNWCRNPFVSIPPMKRNLVACFSFDDFVILHLNGLTWSLPLLTKNLAGDPPLSVVELSEQLRGALASEQLHRDPQEGSRVSAVLALTAEEPSGATKGCFVLENEPICWNYSDNLFTN